LCRNAHKKAALSLSFDSAELAIANDRCTGVLKTEVFDNASNANNLPNMRDDNASICFAGDTLALREYYFLLID